MPMTKMAGTDEGMDSESLYASGESDSKAPEKESIDQEEAEQNDTGLLPVKVLQGKSSEPLKEGDEVVVKVVAVHGDEAEVAYSNTKPGDIGGGEEQSANEEIDSMDNKASNY